MKAGQRSWPSSATSEPLLSDLESRVIRDYGILNDRVGKDDAFLYGIPYPGCPST